MDSAFEAVGKNGKFQKKISLLVILVSPLISMISIAIPFLVQRPDFLCISKNFQNESNFSCKNEEICYNNEIEISKNLKNSLKNWAYDYDLYCDKAYIAPVFGTLYFVGGLIGVIFLYPLADKFGREKIYKFFIIISFFLHLNAFIAFSIINLALVCLLMGFIDYIYMFSCLIITEYLDRDKSGLIMSINNSLFPLIGIFMALLFKFFNNWRIIFFITSLIGLLNIYLSQKYFVESPRWLLSKNRVYEAIEIFHKIAKINETEKSFEKFLKTNSDNLNFENIFLINKDQNLNLIENCNDLKAINLEDKSFAFLDILKFKSQKDKIIDMSLIWSATVFCYYGLIFYMEKLGDSIISLSILIFIGEIITELSSGFFADKFGRVLVLKISFFVGGLGFFLYSISNNDFLKVIFLFITSLGICADYNVIYIYTPEIFPTSIRSTVMGNLYLVSRIGALLIPTINSYFPNSPILFAIIQFIALYICFS